MPPLQEILRSLYGAYILARRNAKGMAFFKVSVEGFWHSFFAAVIIAPLYFLLLYLRFKAGETSASPSRYIMVEAISYVISWTAFPVVMLSVSQFLERQDKYLGYIVAYNWAALLQNALYLPLAILSAGGLLAAPAERALSLMAMALILAYTWFVAKTALVLPSATAFTIVILDLVIGVFINVAARSIM